MDLQGIGGLTVGGKQLIVGPAGTSSSAPNVIYPPSSGYSGGSSGGYGSGGGGGSSAPAYDPADIAYLDSQAGNLQRMLQSSNAGLSNGIAALDDSYNREQSNANGQRSRALEDYAKQGVINEQDKQSGINTVDTNARSLNNSLRRILGMASGSSSSAYQLAAPNAVARQASGQREGVLNSFGRNSEALTTAEDRAKVDFQNLLDNLAAQRRQKESDLRSNVLNQQNDIQAKLGDVAAQRAQALGGSKGSILQAREPYQAAIGNNQNALDNLFAQYRNPTYNVKPVEVKPVDLAKYSVDKAAINAQNAGGPSANSPYSYFLNKKDDQTNAVTGA